MEIVITDKQMLILFLISSDPGVRDIYNLVKVFDRADFPSEMGENLSPLLINGWIKVASLFDNGTPKDYSITEKGLLHLQKNFNEEKIFKYILTIDNPEVLMKRVQLYITNKTQREDYTDL